MITIDDQPIFTEEYDLLLKQAQERGGFSYLKKLKELVIGSGNTSFRADKNGIWLGHAVFGSAPFRVDMAGNITCSAITISGGTVSGIILTGLAAGSEISIQGWQSTLVFTADSYRQVSWSAGNDETITLLDGTVYTIVAGNTNSMSALTYIYLDIAVSITALQSSDTASDAIGTGKILIGVARNNDDTESNATFQIFGGKGGALWTTENIAANTVTANEIVANTITANELNIVTLSSISANIGTITSGAINGVIVTAGTIRSSSGNDRIEMTSGDALLVYDSGTIVMQMTSGGIAWSAGATPAWFAKLLSNELIFEAYDSDPTVRFLFNYSDPSFTAFNPADLGRAAKPWRTIYCNYWDGNLLSTETGEDNIGSDSNYWNEVHCRSIVDYTPKVFSKGLLLLDTINKGGDGKIDKETLAAGFKHKGGGVLIHNIIMANTSAIKELNSKLKKIENK